MNKKIYFLISFLIVITITIKYFSIEKFNPPFFNFFSYDFFSTRNTDDEMKLKMNSNNGNLETVASIVNDPKKIQLISPWGLGMALSFAASMSNSKKYANNFEKKEAFNKIILTILNSKLPIDNDYLGEILVYAVNQNNLDIVKAILKNPYAKYIDKSFKVAIFLQAYMGNPTPMPSSFLQESLKIAIKNNNKEIVSELLQDPVLKNNFPKKVKENALALLAK